MNKSMAGIPVADYTKVAKEFNPVKFDAKAIAQLAKDAGMKYIIITSKHHEGFAYGRRHIPNGMPWIWGPKKI
jgi:alpha-L-fucosidase